MPKKKIHLLNALKYSVSMFYISICFIESILFQEKFTKTRIYIYVISQIFNMYWDIKMDWGFPRKNIMYHWTLSLFIYISNIFLRLSLLMQLAYKDVDLEVYLAVGEITRRFLWTLLRVDHEHINNCDRLKALTMITLPHSDLFYRRDKENNDNGESEDLNKESSCFDETKIV
ncbi:Xenotropic and polytropic retrovirus receptor 1 [Gurleya vavrai]